MVTPKYTDLSDFKTYSTHLQNFAIKFAIFVVLGVCMYGILWGFLRVFHVENVHPPPSRNDFKCIDKSNSFKIEQRGSFWVLQNYIRANRSFRCDESVTLATVGDVTSLDDLAFLAGRWKGPISLALYTPWTDFEAALSKIKYLKTCESPIISEYVTFHFYFEGDHRPSAIPRDNGPTDENEMQKLCSGASSMRYLKTTNVYRKQKGLPFPINVGRNVARNAATTHFILSSGIEFYPSENLIPNFLAMIKGGEYFQRETSSVFVLPAFEVEDGTSYINLPSNKTELVSLLERKVAFNYNNQLRSNRPSLPKYEDWLKVPTDEDLRVFYTTKRNETWMPYFIGTNQDPYYDERLTWEGKCDRLTQAYSMCLMNFDYHILNNAFLVRKLSKEERNAAQHVSIIRAKKLIKNHIGPEIKTLYGTKDSCWLNTSLLL